MYSGYINVDMNSNRNLFYWLVESSSGTPSTDPLVLWTNGGPGCSSLSGGLFSEFGPFFPDIDGSLALTPNIYTWTQMANVIFIEQPAGVGFSWSANTSDYTTGDAQAAMDVYVFLQNFLKLYPKYINRPIFLTGESYGGHYVPMFARVIVEQNLLKMPHINLAGFAVGNAWTVAELDNTGALDFWLSRSMIDQATHDGVLATCNMSDIGPLLAKLKTVSVRAPWEIKNNFNVEINSRPLGFTPLHDIDNNTAKVWRDLDCDGWTNQAFNLISGINIYDVYADVCTSSNKKKLLRSIPSSNNNAGCANNYDPCRDDKTTAYLNNVKVKASIHANNSITWSGCSSLVAYNRYDLLSSMLPVYEYLFTNAPELRILVYSGDVDAIVPTLGTVSWLARLNLQELVPIRAYTVDSQVGGWTTTYNKLTFATVRNAGHMVPEMQGERGLYLFKQFLLGKPL